MKYQPKVPLLVDSPIREGETVFLVWNGEAGRFFRHDRKPGFWSVVPDGQVAESAEKRRLSDTGAPATIWHRLEFRTDQAARGYASDRKRDGYGSYLGDVDRYLTRVIIEDPAYFPRLPMTRPLRILGLDIEQRSEGKGFPPRDAPIVSIALTDCEERPHVVVSGRGPDGEPDDSACIAAFKDHVLVYDPDIIVGYNVNYDLGVLAERSKLYGFPLEQWGREDENKEKARSLVRKERRGDTENFDDVHYVGGRIVWDLQDNANPVSDYNLSGVKDLKLKTIAEFLAWPVKKEDTSNTLAVWRDRPNDLADYNANDAELVRLMVERYLPDRIGMAEFFGAPLDNVLDVRSGWPGTIASARAEFQAGILSDGTNYERHRKYLKAQDAPDEDALDDEGKDVKKFEGAYAEIYKRGLHRPVWKIDYASLYPNVLIAVGAGPENTRIVSTEPLSIFSVDQNGDSLTLHIPDANYNHNWLIEVRGKSAFVETMRQRMVERLAAKAAKDETRANILKTQLNAMFGSNGSLGNRYGVYPVAIICTGVGRQLIQAVERFLKDSKIETDTDGVYTDAKPVLPLIVRAVNREAERWGFEPRFTMDLDEYPAGWFHEAKQYLLLDKRGRFLRKGAALKGRAHPPIFDIIIDRVGNKLLREGRAAAFAEAKSCLDLKTYTPRDFIQRCRLNKPIANYEHQTKEVGIALAYQKLFGMEPKQGYSYEYVRTREGRVPATNENLARIDEYAYLNGAILTALGRLGFKDPVELGLKQRLQVSKARSKRPDDEVSLAQFG